MENGKIERARSYPFLFPDNVDVASVSVGDSYRRSSVFVDLLMTKETNVSSHVNGQRGHWYSFGFGFEDGARAREEAARLGVEGKKCFLCSLIP